MNTIYNKMSVIVKYCSEATWSALHFLQSSMKMVDIMTSIFALAFVLFHSCVDSGLWKIDYVCVKLFASLTSLELQSQVWTSDSHIWSFYKTWSPPVCWDTGSYLQTHTCTPIRENHAFVTETSNQNPGFSETGNDFIFLLKQRFCAQQRNHISSHTNFVLSEVLIVESFNVKNLGMFVMLWVKLTPVGFNVIHLF